MKVKEFFAVTAALALCGTAMACDTTWDGSASDRWSDADNWSAGVPDADDRAIFPALSGVYAVTVDVDAFAALLDVHANATLTIGTGNTLTLDGFTTCGGGSTGVQVINGAIVLEGDASTIRFDDMDQTVQGAGNISGQNAAAQLQIEKAGTSDDFELTVKLLVQGAMQIEPIGAGAGTATFDLTRSSASVEGRVLANYNGIMSFDTNLRLFATKFVSGQNTYRPEFRVDGDNSGDPDYKLQFNRAADDSDADHPKLCDADMTIVECGTWDSQVGDVYINNWTLTSGRILTGGTTTTVCVYGCSSGSVCNTDSAGSCSFP